MKKFSLIFGMVFLGCAAAHAQDAYFSWLDQSHMTEWLDEEGFPLIEEPDFVEWSTDVLNAVDKFKKVLATKNPQLIAQNVVYPYEIGRGVPSIKNEQEFAEKYEIILPKYLRQYLTDSPMKYWGYNFPDDTVCLYWCHNAKITPDGKIIHLKTTKKLKQYCDEQIAAEKQIIHPSLKNYNYNVHTMETKDWLIRIDDMTGMYEPPVDENPTKYYRFAAWKQGKTISDEPDIVIERGLKSGRSRWENQKFTFSSPEYYCTLTEKSKRLRPTDTPEYSLHLYKSMISDEPKIK